MKESEMGEIARMIVRVLKEPANMELKAKVRQDVKELCNSFQIYRDLCPTDTYR